jgi:hypothetical protein
VADNRQHAIKKATSPVPAGSRVTFFSRPKRK